MARRCFVPSTEQRLALRAARSLGANVYFLCVCLSAYARYNNHQQLHVRKIYTTRTHSLERVHTIKFVRVCEQSRKLTHHAYYLCVAFVVVTAAPKLFPSSGVVRQRRLMQIYRSLMMSYGAAKIRRAKLERASRNK